MDNLKPLMSSANQGWQTPEHILDLVRAIAPIGLDPATHSSNPTRAAVFYSEHGLETAWTLQPGQALWLNPPFKGIRPWVERWAAMSEAIRKSKADVHALMLAPARTDTKWFRTLINGASMVCFLSGRLTFKGAPAPAPFPTVIAYTGSNRIAFYDCFASKGWIHHGES